MKKAILISTVLVASLVFSRYAKKTIYPTAPPVNYGSSNTSGGAVPAADEKSGDTTKTGVISTAGGSYFLAEAGQSPKKIESYVVDLSEYVGQTVTVVGQYSGDTLFVGEIK